MDKIGYAIQMSFQVPDSERRIAEKASELFSELNAMVRMSIRHLNIIHEPFSKSKEPLDSEVIIKYRRVFRRYRNQIKKNLYSLIKKAESCAITMAKFSSDSKITEMMNSFLGNVKDVEKAGEKLLGSFSELDSDKFKDLVIATVDMVKKQLQQLKQLINDRILDHIDSNILAKNYVGSLTDEEGKMVYDKLPMIVELYKQRQEAMGLS